MLYLDLKCKIKVYHYEWYTFILLGGFTLKKSLLISIVGIIIVGTVILCAGNKERSYKKSMIFTSPTEIVEIINNESIGVYDNQKGDIVNTTKFLECLSKRKRITYSKLNYESINAKKLDEDNTEEIRNEIINSYKNKCKSLYGVSAPDKLDAVRLSGYGIYNVNAYSVNRGDYEHSDDVEIDIVFIDEGEGWVIDYFWISNLNGVNGNDKNNQQQ